MEEIWKKIDECQYYSISNLGRVRNDRTNYILKPILQRDGYYHICLHDNGQQIQRSVHRLVAIAFLPNPNNLPEVNHINEDKSCNSVDNLEWCGRIYNGNYSYGKPVLQFTRDMKLVNEFVGSYEAERSTGINAANIRHCCSGRRKSAGGYIWKWK